MFFLLGEHRAASVKRLAYEAAQPGLWIAGPDPVGILATRFATNLDLVADARKSFGGVVPWSKLDGRAPPKCVARARPRARSISAYPRAIEDADVGKQPTGDGVRTWRYKYVKYADGSQEMYDLSGIHTNKIVS